jgi:hypothetical protein
MINHIEGGATKVGRRGRPESEHPFQSVWLKGRVVIEEGG